MVTRHLVDTLGYLYRLNKGDTCHYVRFKVLDRARLVVLPVFSLFGFIFTVQTMRVVLNFSAKKQIMAFSKLR